MQNTVVFGEICSYFEKALILFALFIFSSASAVELQHYRMSHGLVFETLEDTKIDNSHVMNNYRTLFTAGYSWANEPLVFKSVNNNFGDNSQVIEDMQTLHIGIGHYLNERLMIGVRGSYSIIEPELGDQVQDFNNVILDLKWRFWRSRRSALVIQPYLTYGNDAEAFTPADSNGNVLGPAGNFFSDEGLGFGARLVYEKLFSFGNFVANLGYSYADGALYDQNPQGRFEGIDKKSLISLGAGLYLPIKKTFGANIELKQNITTPFNSNLNPSEAYFGLSGGLSKRIHIFGGAGLRDVFSSEFFNDVRLSAGLKVIFREEKNSSKTQTKDYRTVRKTSLEEYLGVESKLNIKSCNSDYLFGHTNAFVIRFRNNSVAVKGGAPLIKAAKIIAQNKDIIEKVSIVGHASKVGPQAHNYSLSLKRARVVHGVLVSQGLESKKVTLLAKDHSDLLALGQSELAHEKNRRTEVLVHLKKGTKGLKCLK